MESKKITKVEHRHNGHVLLEFADSSMKMLVRGEKVPRVGDFYPEVVHAVDEKASEEVVVEREPAVKHSARKDESGATHEPGDGPRKKGKHRIKKAKA